MRWRAAGISDPGRRRSVNEDSWTVLERPGLFLVADGMGGHAAGEVASRMAVEITSDHLRRARGRQLNFHGGFRRGYGEGLNRLASGLHLANEAIFNSSLENPAWHGMGTTVAAACWSNGQLGLAHVGDSRIYRLRNGELELLTEDHSLVVEQVRDGLLTADAAERSTLRHVVTRALGQKSLVDVALQEVPVQSGDRFLLCTDGLSDPLAAERVRALLQEQRRPFQACRALVDAANGAGGPDNITAIVIDCAPFFWPWESGEFSGGTQ